LKAVCALLAADSDNMTTIAKLWRCAVREIQLEDAKASLSSLIGDAARGVPSIITRQGKPEAVVVGFEEWERLTRGPSFGQLLMWAPIGAQNLPRRNRKPIRRVKL
jgi:antitoxin Phd